MTQPGKRRSTIKDVARAAGVTVSTVSQALNGKGYVREETRKKVLAAARSLSYHPNARARHLRGGGMKSIALISCMPFGVSGGPSRLGFLMEIAGQAATAALTRGMALVLVPPTPYGEAPLDSLDIDGVLVVEPSADEPWMDRLAELGLPLVSLGRRPEHENMPWVDLNSTATANLLLEHLWSRGARRPALLVGRSRRASYLETEAAYLEFCRARNLAPHIAKADEAGGEAAGQAATAELLGGHPNIDGLCALVDAFASGSLAAARARGLRVPEDLKIVTRYDGLRAKTANPPLTAVNLHLEEVAALGLELLFSRLSGEEGALTLYPSSPTLVPRESSG